MATVETLLTAEEFADMPDDGRRTELVRGRIVEMPPPGGPHGRACNLAGMFIGHYALTHDLGRAFNNDTGVVTDRDPDSVRGADVSFYSYARMPRGPMPDGYPARSPELVIEVRSPSDRPREVEAKVAEYLAAGVLVVCVLDPKDRSARLSYPGRPAVVLGPNDELTFPECLGDFRIIVRQLFGE